MTELFKNIIMGLVQGISEFLPISSSGHLVLFGDILNIDEVKGNNILLSVVVHLGTLAAVLLYFRKEIWAMIKAIPLLPKYFSNGMKAQNDPEKQAAMIYYIIIATIPAGVIGLLFKDNFEALFSNRSAVLVALAGTGLILWSSRFAKEQYVDINAVHALIIGFAQALAIIPGISRSGTTITIALWLGLTKSTSASFSFLMSIPIILGACILEIKSIGLEGLSSDQWLNISAACITAAISGYLSIKLLTYIIKQQKLEYFAIYCFLVSIGGFLFL